MGSPAVGFGIMTNVDMGSKSPDARTSADMKARMILAAGLSVSAATLSAWLIVWLIFFQAKVGLEVFSFGWEEAPAVNPSVSFQERDARSFRTCASSDGRQGVAQLLESLRSYLRDRQGRPSIVFLSAPGYRSALAKDDQPGERSGCARGVQWGLARGGIARWQRRRPEVGDRRVQRRAW